jgi:hypothetical protein
MRSMREVAVIRRIRLFGITVLSIETDDNESDGPGDTTTNATPLGFAVRDDGAMPHRREGWE